VVNYYEFSVAIFAGLLHRRKKKITELLKTITSWLWKFRGKWLYWWKQF